MNYTYILIYLQLAVTHAPQPVVDLCSESCLVFCDITGG